MPLVTLNNINYEIDYYGYIVGSEYETQLSTCHGLINCRLRRLIFGKRLLIQADLWQTTTFLNCTITDFCAGALTIPEGDHYRVESKQFHNRNDFWIELEILISSTIIIKHYKRIKQRFNRL